MGENPASESSATPQPRRSAAVRFAPIVVVVLLVALTFVMLSRPTPGRRTTTDTSVQVVVSTADAEASSQYPITLMEGGDPAHESDHVFESLMGVEGVANATLDWSSGVVLTVEFDPDAISAQQIASIVMQSGYLSTPSGQ